MKIAVLMATYNGEKYIIKQINSILKQKGIKETVSRVDIYIRDDHSIDSTVEILNSFRKNEIFYIKCAKNNIGPCRSFFELIKEVPCNYDLYLFSDQDDIWNDYKINYYCKYLQNSKLNKPVLITSNYAMIDSSDKLLKRVNISANHKFSNALIQNKIIGCTMGINQEMLKLLRKGEPAVCRMHDFWMYQVITGLGEIVFVEEPTLEYRQHDNNVVGGNNNLLRRIKLFHKRYKKNYGHCSLYRQASELNIIYGDLLSKENKTILNRYLLSKKSIKNRVCYLFVTGVSRGNLLETVVFKLLNFFDII